MTYNDLLTGTFTGIIISDFVAKDGRRIGFITPTLPAVCGAVTAWKLENGTKKHSDGNLQFVFPVEGDKTRKVAGKAFSPKKNMFVPVWRATGNAFGLKKGMLVKFSIRFDGKGLPQAYNVQPCDRELTTTPMPKSFVPAPVTAIPESTPAMEAGMASYSESDNLLADDDYDEEDYSEYDEYDDDATEKHGGRDWQ